MSITQITFKIQCCFKTLFPNYSQDNFSITTKAGYIMHKQGSCSHAKNWNLLWSLKPYIFKNDTQMWKLHRKLNFPNFFRLAAIHTWAPAFNSATIKIRLAQRPQAPSEGLYFYFSPSPTKMTSLYERNMLELDMKRQMNF